MAGPGGSGWSPSGTDWRWTETQRQRIRERNAEPLHVIGMDLCWCGEEKNHDWAGRTDGLPHPRPNSEPKGTN